MSVARLGSKIDTKGIQYAQVLLLECEKQHVLYPTGDSR